MRGQTVVIEISVVCRPQVEAAPSSHCVHMSISSVRGDSLAAIKAEALRIAGDGTRESWKLVERVFRAIPELKGA